jgi:hypothetical protein
MEERLTLDQEGRRFEPCLRSKLTTMSTQQPSITPTDRTISLNQSGTIEESHGTV